MGMEGKNLVDMSQEILNLKEGLNAYSQLCDVEVLKRELVNINDKVIQAEKRYMDCLKLEELLNIVITDKEEYLTITERLSLGERGLSILKRLQKVYENDANNTSIEIEGGGGDSLGYYYIDYEEDEDSGIEGRPLDSYLKENYVTTIKLDVDKNYRDSKNYSEGYYQKIYDVRKLDVYVNKLVKLLLEEYYKELNDVRDSLKYIEKTNKYNLFEEAKNLNGYSSQLLTYRQLKNKGVVISEDVLKRAKDLLNRLGLGFEYGIDYTEIKEHIGSDTGIENRIKILCKVI